MNDKDRTKAFEKSKKAELKAFAKEQKQSLKEIKTTLQKAKKDVLKALSGVSSEWREWQLRELQQAIEQALKEVELRLSEIAESSAINSWNHGIKIVDNPLAAGGIRIAAILPVIDIEQLNAMKSFMVDKMTDITSEMQRKIKNELGNIMIGIATPGESITRIAGNIDGGRSRAITIIRTEMGRAYSIASQKRQAQAKEILPGLKKQWRRSGKTHSRITHDLADGQIVDVNQPFTIGNHKLMHPRDPKAPAAETINCGCISLPYMEHWDLRQPNRQPLNDLERQNLKKKELEGFFG